MTAKPTRMPAKKKPPAVVQTSQSIAEQTRAFLKSGGTIEIINPGVSGQKSLAGPKHITLSNNKPQS